MQRRKTREKKKVENKDAVYICTVYSYRKRKRKLRGIERERKKKVRLEMGTEKKGRREMSKGHT